MKFIYVAVFVAAPVADQVSLLNSLQERITGVPKADVIPPLHASGITFKHTFIEADSEDDAYAEGGRIMDGRRPDGCLAFNDYVIAV